MEAAEIVDRIDAERLEAAHAEWERHDRVRRVLLGSLQRAGDLARQIAMQTFGDERAIELVGELEGITEVLRGDWLQSPRTMRAQRGGTKRCNS